MLGEIKKFIRDDGIIKISRSTKELGFKIQEIEKMYFSTTGENLTVKKIANILDQPEENIYIALEACRGVDSINEKIDEDGNELVEILKNDEDEQSKLVDKLAINDLIRKLNSREKTIINLRYFNDKTQSQVAKILGISQVHVSRIEKRILNDFKNIMLA